MLYLFFTDLLFFFVFSGIGFLVSRSGFLKVREDNFFLSFFLGLALSAIYFSLINFFLPLTLWTLMPVVFAGLAGCAVFVRGVSSGDGGSFLFKRRWWLLLGTFVFFIVCYECSKAESVSLVDTLLYHSTIVSWMNAYKVVPGLVNVFGPLGSNSLYLQLAAGLDVGPWDKQMSSVLFSLFYAAFILYTLADIHNASVKRYRGSLPVALLQSVMLIWFITNNILDDPSLYYDKPALVFIAITLVELLFRQQGDAPKSSDEAIFFFVSAAFGTKLLGALSVALVFTFLVIRRVREHSFSIPGLIRMGILPLFILLLYVARNLIQSGYPFIPSTAFRMNFPWTVPEWLALRTYEQIYWGTRWNGEGASWGTPASSFMEWFVPWCKRLLRPENWQFIVITVVSLPLLVRSFIRRGKQASFFNILVLANLAYWFAFAPNLRFGNGFFYDMLAVALFFNADLFAAPIKKLSECIPPFVSSFRRLKLLGEKPFLILSLVLLLLFAACLLTIPAVQDFLISLGGTLKGKQLSVPHWKREFNKCVRCCAIIAAFLVLLPYISRQWKSGFAFSCWLLTAFFCCEIAIKNRNLLMTIPVKPEPTERRLVNAEQNLYINISTNIDLCGDAPLPCAPAGSFRTSLRLFDKDDMGKGFYIEEPVN
ncbi:MAG: hypothetical protein IJU95_06360 [Treponema sp.]|nr:hypothetical protein [Treponema sp.]